MERLSSQGLACYTSRDLIIYALGIGFGGNSSGTASGNSGDGDKEEYDLRHVYENHDDFSPFPTFPLVLPFRAKSLQSLEAVAATTKGFRTGVPNSHYFDMPPFPTSMMNEMNVVEFISHCMNQNAREIKEKQQGRDNKGEKQQGSDGDTRKLEISSILHLSEKYRLHQCIPNTVHGQAYIKLQTDVVSVQPKRIGIIVITETRYYIINHEGVNTKTSNFDSGGHNYEGGKDQSLLATSQSTTLYIIKNHGYDSNNISLPSPLHSSLKSATTVVRRVGIGIPKQWTKKTISHYMKHNQPDNVQSRIKIHNNQALIYRLSGDTNYIHVISTPTSQMATEDRPILHGLCTLGFAARIIMEYCQSLLLTTPLQQNKMVQRLEFQYISCDFVKPVFVGDEIDVCIWIGKNIGNDQQQDQHRCEEKIDGKTIFMLFQVRRSSDGLVLVKNGIVEVIEKRISLLQSQSLDVNHGGGKEERNMVFSSKL